MDVVVVGAGVVGASAAHRLALAGARVTLVDPRLDGQATAAGAGIVAPTGHFPPSDVVLPLVGAALEFLPRLVGELRADGEPDTGFARSGALHVATTQSEAARLTQVLRHADARVAAGFPGAAPGALVDGTAARARFPALAPSIRAAAELPGWGRLDGRRLRAALEAAARRRGAWVVEAAARLVPAAGGCAVHAAGRTLPADAVVLAAGAWSGALAAEVGLKLPVRAQRGQLAHLRLRGTDTAEWPVVVGFHSHYLLAFPPDRVVVGATHEDTDAPAVTAAGVHEVLGDALRIAPGLAAAELVELRAGLRPVLPDALPALGHAPAVPNLVVATGHGAYGLQMGPFSGALAAELAVGGVASFDLSPFDPGRFAR
jgi:D-amino-acid dehydrogenase